MGIEGLGEAKLRHVTRHDNPGRGWVGWQVRFRWGEVLWGARPPETAPIVLRVHARPYRSVKAPAPRFQAGRKILFCWANGPADRAAAVTGHIRGSGAKRAGLDGRPQVSAGHGRAPASLRLPQLAHASANA